MWAWSASILTRPQAARLGQPDVCDGTLFATQCEPLHLHYIKIHLNSLLKTSIALNVASINSVQKFHPLLSPITFCKLIITKEMGQQMSQMYPLTYGKGT